MRLYPQIERHLDNTLGVKHPYGESRHSKKWLKQQKLRGERHRANIDPETQPNYRSYAGWDW